jgi:putative endonuclease
VEVQKVKPGYVYILTNKPDGVLYIGGTSDLSNRIEQHRSRAVPGFTKKYNCHRLVWVQPFDNIQDARQFEVRMKKWNRDWKVKRIVEMNPEWKDLFEEGLIP